MFSDQSGELLRQLTVITARPVCAISTYHGI